MELSNILAKGSIINCAKVTSKRQLLQQCANQIEQDIGVSSQLIFNSLMAREQLGSTGLGNGIAIPHGKLDNINGITAVFVRLEHPIDFDSVDDMPVDLVFMLIAPTGSGADHLKALALVARLLRDDNITKLLRQTNDSDKLYQTLTAPTQNINAA